MTNQAPIEDRLRELNLRWLELARCGDFERAWLISDQACATRRGIDCSHWPRHQQFIWRGDDVRARRLLVRCYHGLGDTIQFARFLPRLRERARDVVLWTQPVLIPILRTLQQGADRVLPLHDATPDVDYDVDLELFEVMHALRVPLRDVASPNAYLLPDEQWQPPAGDELHVGLVWRAGDWDSDRSIPPQLLAPLGELDGVRWHLLQRGPALSGWHNDFGDVPTLADILSEARHLRRLHLLVSVDTCSAHLAGALGVPVWTLLPHTADWRWMRDRADSPWYPSMTLIRQERPGHWSGVIARVIVELKRKVRWLRQNGGC